MVHGNNGRDAVYDGRSVASIICKSFVFLLFITFKVLRWMRLGLERTKNNYIHTSVFRIKINDLNDLGWTPNR